MAAEHLHEMTGQELAQHMRQFPSLDPWMDRNPRSFTDEEWNQFILALRAERARLELKEDKRRMKKAGIETGDDDADE